MFSVRHEGDLDAVRLARGGLDGIAGFGKDLELARWAVAETRSTEGPSATGQSFRGRRHRPVLGSVNLGNDLEDGPLPSPVITEY